MGDTPPLGASGSRRGEVGVGTGEGGGSDVNIQTGFVDKIPDTSTKTGHQSTDYEYMHDMGWVGWS